MSLSLSRLSWLSWLPACHRQSKHYSKSNFIRTHWVASLSLTCRQIFNHIIYLLLAGPHVHAAPLLSLSHCVSVSVCVVSICIYVNMLHCVVAVWFLHLYQPQFISGHNKRRLLLPLSPSWLPKPEAATKTKPKTAAAYSCPAPLSLSVSLLTVSEKMLFSILWERVSNASHFLTANNNFAMAKLYFMLWILWKRKQ